MKYTVIGIENVDYVNKSQKHIQGVRLHMTFEDPKKANGHMVEQAFVSHDVVPTVLLPGDDIQLHYNKYGRPESIEVL